MDDHDLDALQFAQRKHEFGPKAQQPILVRERQSPDLPFENRVQEPLQALLPMVQAGSRIVPVRQPFAAQ